MRTSITIKLDLDPEAWTLNYGIEGWPAIRANAKAYTETMIVEHFRDLGLLLEEDAHE
jgi:hypothetical protein